MSIVADRGLKKSQFTSARLKNGEVLYVETHVHRSVYSHVVNCVDLLDKIAEFIK